MRAVTSNPDENVLPAGAAEDALTGAVLASGYPLQGTVARQLLGSFTVIEEWDYVDDDTKQHRNLDLYAIKTYGEAQDYVCSVGLLIECKRSRHPFVFFQRVAEGPIPRFPLIAGISGEAVTLRTHSSQTTVQPAAVMGLPSEPFVSSGPPACSTMTRARLEGKKVQLHGDESFRELILPLVKAMRYATGLYKQDNRGSVFPVMLLGIAVIDAPMVLVEDPTKAADPVLCPWVRVIRREPNPERHSWSKSRFYAIDVVHAAFLSTFASSHLLPFAELFAQRCQSMRHILRAGGHVKNLREWTWNEIKAVSTTM